MIEIEFQRGDFKFRLKFNAALLFWVVVNAIVLAGTHWAGYLS